MLRPAGPGPLVIFLHGGFWRHEYDRAHTGPLATALAGAGFAVATPEYRRTGGDGGWPDHARRRGGRGARGTGPDPGGRACHGRTGGRAGRALGRGTPRAVGGGASADPVTGVVALAPVADLSAAYELDLDGGAVRALLGGGPDDCADRFAAADPRPGCRWACR